MAFIEEKPEGISKEVWEAFKAERQSLSSCVETSPHQGAVKAIASKAVDEVVGIDPVPYASARDQAEVGQNHIVNQFMRDMIP